MKNKKYKRHNTTKSLHEILAEIINKPTLSHGIYINRAIKAWPVVTGDAVSGITKNVFINNGVMIVNLSSSIIRNELLIHKERIIKKINQEVGADIIKDLVIR